MFTRTVCTDISASHHIMHDGHVLVHFCQSCRLLALLYRMLTWIRTAAVTPGVLLRCARAKRQVGPTWTRPIIGAEHVCPTILLCRVSVINGTWIATIVTWRCDTQPILDLMLAELLTLKASVITTCVSGFGVPRDQTGLQLVLPLHAAAAAMCTCLSSVWDAWFQAACTGSVPHAVLMYIFCLKETRASAALSNG